MAAASPSRACLAQAHERCRATGGASNCARWHAVSAHEHFCQDCVDFYGRGEGWHLWKVTDTPYFFRRNHDLGTISVYMGYREVRSLPPFLEIRMMSAH